MRALPEWIVLIFGFLAGVFLGIAMVSGMYASHFPKQALEWLSIGAVGYAIGSLMAWFLMKIDRYLDS